MLFCPVLCVDRLSLGGEGSAFEQQASSAVLDLMGDEGDRLNQQKKMMKWYKFPYVWLSIHQMVISNYNLKSFFPPSFFRDRKRKRFVRETGKEDQKKKIKTDSGQVISNKKNRKNLYPSNKKLLCVLLSMTLFSTPMTILSCTVKMLYHLTTCQLWGVKEKIQDWWYRIWIRWRNRRRRQEASKR